MEEKSENSQTVQHLWKMGQALATTCPAASRYYIFNLKRYLIDDPSLQTKNLKSHKFCEHCGTLWSPENHRVRIQPVPSKNKHIKKLLKLEANEPWKLNNRQKKKLKKFQEATSKIVYTCFNCKKTVKFPGFKRKSQNHNKRSLLYTLPINLKPKKSDVNAGLFISSPLETVKTENNETYSDSQKQSVSRQPDSNSGNVLDKRKLNLSNSVSFSKSIPLHEQNLSKKKCSPVETLGKKANPQNQKKKKKSLLAQIMKQEQEALKKKTTLSSFLVSL